MALIVDHEHLGPSEARWNAAGHHERLARFGPIAARRLVVVSPHPDDEILGAGGLIQVALSEHVPVMVVSVTDGEASHPRSTAATVLNLARVRSAESRVGLCRLGLRDPLITRLHLPDGNVSAHRRQLDQALASILLPDDLCVAPWRRDGHPDHDVCGESALTACRSAGARMLAYLVWAWHWADPDGFDIPWQQCRRLDLSRRVRAHKRWATAAFESQTRPLGPDVEDAAVLPTPMMRRFWRSYEVYLDELASSQ
ncbi:MAG TPA: PIG-L family deacetylase [Acidimicrobiales bacterium]